MARKASKSRTLIQASRRVPASEKAAFHQILGAGQSHVKRPFFELTDDDENALIDRFEQQLGRLLKEQG